MWDWFSHEEEKEVKSCVLDFTPVSRTMDPTVHAPDVDGETGTDLYNEEEKLFEIKKKKYQIDKETDLGFPDDRREFVAKRCLKEVKEEFNSYSRARDLRPLNKGLGLMLHGDEDFGSDFINNNKYW